MGPHLGLDGRNQLGVVAALVRAAAIVLVAVLVGACDFPGATTTRDVLVGNQDTVPWTVRVVRGDKRVLGVYEVPALTRVRIHGTPVTRDGIFIVAVDSTCTVVTPEPFGSISTNTADAAAAAEILPGGEVLSVPVAALAGYPEQDAARSDRCSPS